MDKTQVKNFPGKIFYMLFYLMLTLIFVISCTGYPTQPEDLSKFQIVFSRERDRGNFEIAAMNDDGSMLRHLTNTPAISELGPRWSPAGNKILCFSRLLFDRYIYIIDLDDFTEHRLVTLESFQYNPDWSPDANRIIFTSEFEFYSHIYSVDLNGTDLCILTQGNGLENTMPKWSPDGNKIAFVGGYSNSESNEIYVMNKLGSDVQRLTNNSYFDFNPVWSPDGEQIAFDTFREGNRDIYLVNSDGSDEKRLTNHPDFDYSPIWSPNGKSILYSHNSQIWIMKSDGSGKRALTFGPGENRNPAWSPNGQRIVFESTRDDSENQYQFSNLYIMNANGTGQKRLTNGPLSEMFPSFSPVPMY